MGKFQVHQKVRIVSLVSPKKNVFSGRPGARAPRIGDVGFVVDLYSRPAEGYGVESTDTNGTNGLCDFSPEEFEASAS
jgi:hypothetical protein